MKNALQKMLYPAHLVVCPSSFCYVKDQRRSTCLSSYMTSELCYHLKTLSIFLLEAISKAQEASSKLLLVVGKFGHCWSIHVGKFTTANSRRACPMLEPKKKTVLQTWTAELYPSLLAQWQRSNLRKFRYGALRNGKVIALNSAEIKIVRTKTKTPHEEFS